MNSHCEHTSVYRHDYAEIGNTFVRDCFCRDCGYQFYTAAVEVTEGMKPGVEKEHYAEVSTFWHELIVTQATGTIVELMDMWESEIKARQEAEKRAIQAEQRAHKAVQRLMRECKWWIDNLSTAIRLVSEVTIHRDRNINALAAIHDLNAVRSGIERAGLETMETLTGTPASRDTDDIPF